MKLGKCQLLFIVSVHVFSSAGARFLMEKEGFACIFAEEYSMFYLILQAVMSYSAGPI